MSEFATSQRKIDALLHLLDQYFLDFYTSPAPFAANPGPRPQASPLVRAMVAHDESLIHTLSHDDVDIESPGLRRLLLLLDGSRDVSEIEKADHGVASGEIRKALDNAAKLALLVE